MKVFIVTKHSTGKVTVRTTDPYSKGTAKQRTRWILDHTTTTATISTKTRKTLARSQAR